ncbi:MAG: CDP-alcohol phosphatidyltransferase family protein [Caulobacteraceae bacterium]|nr:CDP-alcohol phosphatidyltransferase family protein [Caulobacteraceae bacterium]
MESSPLLATPPAGAAPGRPVEIEEATNRYLIHPLSRALVDGLARTHVTPDQVSVASVFMAAAGALCYARLNAPWGAFAGLAFLFAWHVLDGADGDLARRTGRASTSGELVDGVCDHVSQALVYVAFAVILQRTLGLGAWAWAVAAALSHFIQANAYETGRKTYRRWVHGATWMRQNLESLNRSGAVQGLLGDLYVGLSVLVSPGEARLEAVMEPRLAAGGETAQALKGHYRRYFAPVVKASAVLGANSRTIAAFLAILANRPLWFFLFEVVALNLALAGFTLWRGRRNRALAAAIS